MLFKSIHPRVSKAMLMALALLPSLSQAWWPDDGHSHWVALFPSSFSETDESEWNVFVFNEPNMKAEHIGQIVVRFTPQEGFKATYEYKDRKTEPRELEPHLYDPDYGYGPYFHLTAIDVDRRWVKIRADPSAAAVWADFERAFGNETVFRELGKGDILSYGDSSIVIEHLNEDNLIVRPEQDVDMHCGEPGFSFSPYTTYQINRADWIDNKGRSRFDVPFSRGC